MYNALAIDVGGTKISAAIVGAEGCVRRQTTVATPMKGGGRAILQAVGELGRALLMQGRAEGLEIVGVGVGTAGMVDAEREEVFYATGNLPGWMGIPIARELETLFGLPVFVENDVKAMALGEYHFGAGRTFDHCFYVMVGTGVGGAVMMNGRLWRGVNGSAGEIAHLLVDHRLERQCSCGQRGHLEAYASGPAMVQHYRELVGLVEQVDLPAVALKAYQGDRLARQAVEEGAQVLGRGLSGLLCAFDFQALILGGGVTKLGDLWWAPLLAVLRQAPWPAATRLVIRPAQLGAQVVLIGAGWMALQGVGD